MSFPINDRQAIDPEYFSLRVRQAVRDHDQNGPDEDSAEVVALEDFSAEELYSHPEVVEAGAAVVDAESAVLAAEEAGTTDELAMYRLDKARAAERAVLVRLQKARTAEHTSRATTRAAQVLPLRPFRVIKGGEAA